MSETILIVDDDPVQRRLLEAMVQRFGYQALTADGGDAALRMLDGTQPIDCVVLDLVMPDLDGLGVLERMRERGIDIPVIVQTAHGGIDNVVSVMRAGATDFVVKPASPERLQVSLRNALGTKALAGELRRLKRSRDGTLTIADVITRSDAMRPVLRAAEKAAASTIPVLIGGESGVGKELIARAIHGSGARAAKPFIAVNCGAMPENLVESILFGHEKGAFTGADRRRIGKFEQAHQGALFLDEISDMSPATQAKVLRVLQEQRFERLGGNETIQTDVRLIAATNKDLEQEVAAGRFRGDLFYRLNVYAIPLPPLRERRDDLPLLVEHFLRLFSRSLGRNIVSVTDEARRCLEAYDWPGNVRELQSVLKYGIIQAPGEVLTLDCLPEALRAATQSLPALPAPQPAADAPTVDVARLTAGLLRAGEPDIYRRISLEVDRVVMNAVLRHTKGNQVQASELLGISRTTLRAKLRALGMSVEKQLLPEPDGPE
jgi:DNA-binding NtrC family response regulator